MNVLIADDEVQMVKIISAYFKKEGFNTFEAFNGDDALDVFQENKIDLAVLDWMMPKIDGLEVCKYIKENSHTKVLLLTAKGENDDEIEALSCGADEYIKKPFDPRILILRAKKLLNLGEEISVNNIKIDLHKKQAYKNNILLNLTKIEYEILFSLIKNRGMILSRSKLIDLVWGIDYEGDYRTVDTHMSRLRNKVGEDVIKTYRGLGYRIEGDEYKDK